MVDAKENNSAHKKKQQLYVAIALGSIAVAIGIFSRVCLPSDVAMRLIGEQHAKNISPEDCCSYRCKLYRQGMGRVKPSCCPVHSAKI